MFTEPQTVKAGADSISLPRVSYGDRNGLFENIPTGLRLRVSHLLGKRTRRNVRLDFTKTAADPLLDGVSRQYSMSAYVVIDHPQVGFSASEIEANAKSLTDWLAVAGNLTKVVNGES